MGLVVFFGVGCVEVVVLAGVVGAPAVAAVEDIFDAFVGRELARQAGPGC